MIEKFKVIIPRPRLLIGGQSQLMCEFYPGDMDKIGFGAEYCKTNDVILAHRLHEWFKQFQTLTEWGTECTTPEQHAEWQAFAQRFLAKSEEFM